MTDPLSTDAPVSLRHIPDPAGIDRAMTHIRVAVAERELQIVVANDGDTRVPVPGSTVGIEIPPDAVRLLPC